MMGTITNIQIPGYTFLQKLGSGSVATVYKAEASDGRIVAIKILDKGNELSEEIRLRFRREFQIAIRLEHPNIVRYLDFGVVYFRPFIVMEHVQGTTLWSHVQKKGPLDEASVRRLAMQIGSALDAGHALHILHRDVKPNNILLTPEGNAKLLDFGLVKDLESTLDLTAERAILGTPFFMAPEQFFDAKSADHRTDCYGLAASLFYAVSGKIPFKYSGLGLLEKKLRGQFSPPGEDEDLVPESFRHGIALGLHPDPEKRIQSGAKLVEALNSPGPTMTPGVGAVQDLDRRSSLRRKCDLSGTISGEGTAKITDISSEGVCFVSEEKLKSKSLVTISFYFTQERDCWDYQARVVYASRWEDGLWRHGCRFVCPIDRAELLSILNEHKDNIRVRIIN